MVKYSVIIPVYNEKESLLHLYLELDAVMKKLCESYEIIFINDGSNDNSYQVLKHISLSSNHTIIVNLAKHFGQSYALQAGFDIALGEIIITMDGDLQNDPQDIPRLLKELKKGHAVVCGWRHARFDPWLKKFLSILANLIRRYLLGERIHDVGCTLRAYRRYTLGDINLYGEMHRFLTLLLYKRGFKISEVKVSHYPRRFGKSKYGNLARAITSLPYLLNILFWPKKNGRGKLEKRYNIREVIKGDQYIQY